MKELGSLGTPTQFRFSNEQRQELLEAVGVNDTHPNVPIFVALVEQEIEIFKLALLQPRQARTESGLRFCQVGRPRHAAHRRFVEHLAGHYIDVLNIRPGRGRTGPFPRAVALCFRAAGLKTVDLSDYISDGVSVRIDIDDADLLKRLFKGDERAQYAKAEAEEKEAEAARLDAKQREQNELDAQRKRATKRLKEVERQSTYHILGGTGHPSRFSPPISRKKSTR
jgi:hypothetical protein